MTTTAYCVGLTYPTGDYYNGQHPVPGAAAANETMASIFRDQVGADYVYEGTDADGTAVTRAEILQNLRDLLNRAEPGDNVLFSFTGNGRSHAPRDERDPGAAELEADGANEFIWASDGPITDEDIRQVLQEVPEGVNLVCEYNQRCYGHAWCAIPTHTHAMYSRRASSLTRPRPVAWWTPMCSSVMRSLAT
ncbi:hypothetical protein BCR44DRAFT_331256 [Catenaria anguillulae PL171]|uniref:Caspase domain-domain-containing protein n=1 Tax=Catenaria anguillulae PL171 TaxID=765915 RepID=A0A1Y2HKZ4_9FUNG|nr:hypothetical protein BCR44DRAFT_331256 [Catenaria anguillulae PL171]